jgi:hypothetical protein
MTHIPTSTFAEIHTEQEAGEFLAKDEKFCLQTTTVHQVEKDDKELMLRVLL